MINYPYNPRKLWQIVNRLSIYISIGVCHRGILCFCIKVYLLYMTALSFNNLCSYTLRNFMKKLWNIRILEVGFLGGCSIIY